MGSPAVLALSLLRRCVQVHHYAKRYAISRLPDLLRDDSPSKNVRILASSTFLPFIDLFFETPHRYLTIFFGYFFARKDMFNQAAVKGASLVTINLALPALLFSSIVPTFTATNISVIGSLALLAIVYILTGLLFGLIIREVCYVPRNFWQGIVVASGLSNWSSMRTHWFGPEDSTRPD